MRRRSVAGVFVAFTVVAAAVGWILGSQVRSPAEIAARTEAPEPSPILVPAEMRELSTNVVTRGTGRFGKPIEVVLATSSFKPNSPLVTQLPEPGSEIDEGQILMSSSGRPVFALEGAQPMFRDLGPGVTGEDVRQLEAALDRMGHGPGPVDGTYDTRTEAAVGLLYETRGLAPAVATADQLADIFPDAGSIIAGTRPGAGIQVPADEIVFIPSLPARVAANSIELGHPIEGSVMTITAASVAIDGSVAIEQSGLVRPGMEVVIDEPDLGIEASGVVGRVADQPGTDGVDGFHLYFEVDVPDAPLALINASVRLTIPVESTGDAVLVVPITALSLAPNGSSRVQRQVDGALESIEVRPGLSAQGLVEVTPIGGDLREGDLVVVGFEAGTSVPPASSTPGGAPDG